MIREKVSGWGPGLSRLKPGPQPDTHNRIGYKT